MEQVDHKKLKTCQICHCLFEDFLLIPLDILKEETHSQIREDHPDIDQNGHICREDLWRYYANWIADSEKDHPIEKDLRPATFGQKLADRLTEFGGSWSFIIYFFAVLAIWIAVNTTHNYFKPFDAYPYILMNLILSCLGAIQAPIIMMSQNREAARDRIRAQYDYEVNLKAEVEIRHLHDKIDHLHRNLLKEIRFILSHPKEFSAKDTMDYKLTEDMTSQEKETLVALMTELDAIYNREEAKGEV